MMTRLSELVERLNQLPEQKKRKRLNTRVETLTGKVNDANSKLSAASRMRNCAQIVFPDEVFNVTAKAVRAASRQAAGLKDKLQGDFDEVNSDGTEKKVIRLGDKAKEADDGICRAWPSLMQRQTQPYEALANVATKLNLRGSTALASTMQRLAGCAARPPATDSAAESIRSDLEGLRKSIEKLGLKGEAGQFLIKASQGSADPQDLFKEEVKAFFDDQKLWGLIAVKTK